MGVADDVVELLQRLALPVVGVGQGIALDDVGNGVDQVVEDQVQTQQARRLLGDVLREEGAALFADGVGQAHEQGAGAGGRVVAAYVAHLAPSLFRHQDGGHDPGHGVGGVVLGVFAAAVLVVVLDQVLEEGGVEVVFLGEDALEAEFHQLVDEGAAEVVAFAFVGDVLAHPIEEGDLGPAVGLDREDVIVGDGDVAQGVVEELGELRGVLSAEEVCDEMLRLQTGGVRPHLQHQHLALLGAQLGDRLFPAFGLGQLGVDAFRLEGELVVEKLVEKDLGDDLELVAIVAEAVGGADVLEVVDQLPGLFLEILGYQVVAPVLLPELNSCRYSATTSLLMVREASGLSWIFCRF
jgi:hypothetical protein